MGRASGSGGGGFFWSGMGCMGLGVGWKVGVTIVCGLRESRVLRGTTGESVFVNEGAGFQALQRCICSCVWCEDLSICLCRVISFSLCEVWWRGGFVRWEAV